MSEVVGIHHRLVVVGGDTVLGPRYDFFVVGVDHGRDEDFQNEDE